MSFDKFIPGSVFLYGIGTMLVGVLAYQVIVNRPLDTVVVSIVTSIIGYAVHASGNLQGTTSTNDTVVKTARAQYPLTPEGIESARISGVLKHDNK